MPCPSTLTDVRARAHVVVLLQHLLVRVWGGGHACVGMWWLSGVWVVLVCVGLCV